MKIINKALLAEFALPGLCELCRMPCTAREGHHLIRKGMGNSSQMDIRINLLSTGSTLQWGCRCHNLVHDGKIPHQQVLEIVASREQLNADDMEMALWFICRLDRKLSLTKRLLAIGELEPGVRLIVKRELEAALREKHDSEALRNEIASMRDEIASAHRILDAREIPKNGPFAPLTLPDRIVVATAITDFWMRTAALREAGLRVEEIFQ